MYLHGAMAAGHTPAANFCRRLCRLPPRCLVGRWCQRSSPHYSSLLPALQHAKACGDAEKREGLRLVRKLHLTTLKAGRGILSDAAID